MTHDEMIKALATLKAENEALKVASIRKERSLSCKVTPKGGVSVYGMGRFPVTLYKSQWVKLISYVDQIKAFLAEHDAELSVKENSNKAA